MGYTIHYTGTREEIRALALRDALAYVGANYYRYKLKPLLLRVVTDRALSSKQKFNQVRLVLSFIGVKGAPAKALLRDVWNIPMPSIVGLKATVIRGSSEYHNNTGIVCATKNFNPDGSTFKVCVNFDGLDRIWFSEYDVRIDWPSDATEGE